ncbi:MAG: ATP-binding cassette domain-containing protein [Dermatophilaceae bacterium]
MDNTTSVGMPSATAPEAAARPADTRRGDPGKNTGADVGFLDVRDLKVHFPTDDGLVKAVDGISFRIERGETIGIVGESGSGKSVTSQAILGLHRRSKAQSSGQIWLDGEDLMTVDDERLRELRGNKMAMIFQDPLSAMHPSPTAKGGKRPSHPTTTTTA